jgi:hypothetical protein
MTMQWINRSDATEAIRKMNEDDLRFLNRLIVDRLKLISQARSTVMLANFSVGDRVCFSDSYGQDKSGIIVRLNKKTVSVDTDDGQKWKVHPGFLRSDGHEKGFEHGTRILPLAKIEKEFDG